MLSKGCGFSGWNETKWAFPKWNVLFPYRKPWWWAKSCNLAEKQTLNLTKIWQDCGRDWTRRADGQSLHWQWSLITSKVTSLCNSCIHQSQTITGKWIKDYHCGFAAQECDRRWFFSGSPQAHGWHWTAAAEIVTKLTCLSVLMLSN